MPTVPSDPVPSATAAGSSVDDVQTQRSLLERAVFQTLEVTSTLRAGVDEALDRNRKVLEDVNETLQRVRNLLGRP